jgi:hypothetical protein
VSGLDLDKAEDLHQSTTPGPWAAVPPRRLGGNTPIVATDEVDSDRWILDACWPTDAEFVVHAHRLWSVMCSELRAARDRDAACIREHHPDDFAKVRLGRLEAAARSFLVAADGYLADGTASFGEYEQAAAKLRDALDGAR